MEQSAHKKRGSPTGSLFSLNRQKLIKDRINLLGCVLAFALGAAKSNSNSLLATFAADRAFRVYGLGVTAALVVGGQLAECSLYVLGNLLGAITATNANPNRLISINCLTADGTFLVNGNRFLRGEGIGAEAKNGSNKDRNEFFHNVILLFQISPENSYRSCCNFCHVYIADMGGWRWSKSRYTKKYM